VPGRAPDVTMEEKRMNYRKVNSNDKLSVANIYMDTSVDNMNKFLRDELMKFRPPLCSPRILPHGYFGGLNVKKGTIPMIFRVRRHCRVVHIALTQSTVIQGNEDDESSLAAL